MFTKRTWEDVLLQSAPKELTLELKGVHSQKLLLWEPVNRTFIRACGAEFIAMVFFVTLCCGNAMGENHPEDPSLIKIASSFGFAILAIAQFVGPLSGGHINTAVSLSLWIDGRISLFRFISYTISQMLGSIAGAFILWAIFGNNWPSARAFGSNSWDPDVFNDGNVFFGEMVGTGILILTVFATIDHPSGNGGPLGAFPIAMSVLVAHLFLLPIDGCSINPTRSFGPCVVAIAAGIPGDYRKQHYMFWIGPYAGSLAACTLYILSKKLADPVKAPLGEREGEESEHDKEKV